MPKSPLCPATASASMPSDVMSIFTWPQACAPSHISAAEGGRRRLTAHISGAMPVTLEARVTTTAFVSARTLEAIAAISISPRELSGASSTCTPLSSRYCSGRRTELCSANVVTTLSPARKVPRRAIFRASVQFFVNMVRSHDQPPKNSISSLRQACTRSEQATESL